MKITLPWPHKDLNPNKVKSQHWSKTRRASKHDKTTAFMLTKQAMSGEDIRTVKPDARLSLKFSFYPPDRRRRDRDNAIGACKAFQDGISQALGIDDSMFDVHYSPLLEPVKGGAVIVEVL